MSQYSSGVAAQDVSAAWTRSSPGQIPPRMLCRKGPSSIELPGECSQHPLCVLVSISQT